MIGKRYRWGIVKSDSSVVALVPGDRYVQALSTRLGWKVDTLIKRTQNVLPQKLEQNIFLSLSVDWRVPIHPETFRDIYLYFTNNQWMSDRDLEDREHGRNEYVNKGETVIEKLSLTLNLLYWQKDVGYSIGWLSAAHMVQAYGDDAEDILCMIVENLLEIMDVLRMKMSRFKAFAAIVKEIAELAANANGRRSVPSIASAEDVITLLSSFDSDKGSWQNDDEDV